LSRALDATHELLEAQSKLPAEDREELEKSIYDLVADTPRTGIAALTFKRVVSKLGTEAADLLTVTLYSLMTHEAQQLIFGTPVR
jgi:hypothetical protein